MVSRPESLTGLREIADFLERRCGLVFSDAELPGLRDKLASRLGDLGRQSLRNYLHLIGTYPGGTGELQQLLNLVTINETYFFRIPAHFRVLGETVLPALAEARKHTRQLRIYSAGCSTGEEVYSIAIQVLECPQLAGWDVLIHGADISERAIGQAERGRYKGRTIRSVPGPMLERYFQSSGGDYQVREELRRLCRFEVRNLVDDPPPGHPLDVIFFRNVMIYFQRQTTAGLIRRLESALRPDGYLFLGPSETLWQLDVGLHPHFQDDCFIYRRFPPDDRPAPRPSPPVPVPTSPPRASRPADPGGAPAPARPVLLTASRPTPEGKLRLAREYAEAGGYPEALDILETLPEDPETLYLRCVIHASELDDQAFLEVKDRLLGLDPLHPEARYLFALFLSRHQRIEPALDELQRLLFIDEFLTLPRYFKMMLLEKSGQKTRARQEAENLLAILESGRGTGFRRTLLAAELSPDDLAGHCRRMLAAPR